VAAVVENGVTFKLMSMQPTRWQWINYVLTGCQHAIYPYRSLWM